MSVLIREVSWFRCEILHWDQTSVLIEEDVLILDCLQNIRGSSASLFSGSNVHIRETVFTYKHKTICSI